MERNSLNRDFMLAHMEAEAKKKTLTRLNGAAANANPADRLITGAKIGESRLKYKANAA